MEIQCHKDVFVKLVCRLNVILIKITMSFSLEVENWVPKYIFKHRGL